MNYYKRYIYIFSYVIIIIIIATLNMLSVTDVLDQQLNLKLVANPLIFLLLDGIILYIIMKKLKKEKYRTQQRVLLYFKTINNLFLLVAIIYSGSALSFPVIIIGNFILVFLFSPIPVNSETVNGVEEYFNKYNEKEHHKFYKNIEEIKEDYKPLKEEIEVEIPALDVIIKDQKKEKRKKIIMNIIPIIIITLFIMGILFSTVEYLKSFSRVQYNYFAVSINNQEMNIFYDEAYFKNVIPFVYSQYESYSFQSNHEEYTNDNYLNSNEKYIIKLKEYECINDDKGNDIRVSCGQLALSERKEEIESTNNEMMISCQDHVLYKGIFREDITEYLIGNRTYQITITNKKDNLKTNITFNLSINEIPIGD